MKTPPEAIKKLKKACGNGKLCVTLHPQKRLLRWPTANNTLKKSSLAFGRKTWAVSSLRVYTAQQSGSGAGVR